MNHFYIEFVKNLSSEITLVVVSKNRSVEQILELYNLGQRHFGENKVQELVAKYEALPKDIKWHMIGHLQVNKVKYIIPFIHLIHSVESIKLAEEINKQALKINKVVSCLIQIKISNEISKFGLHFNEVERLEAANFKNIEWSGFMGMASNAIDNELIKKEFNSLNDFFLNKKPSKQNYQYLSMGMSSDYLIAIDCGSNILRIGSLLF